MFFGFVLHERIYISAATTASEFSRANIILAQKGITAEPTPFGEVADSPEIMQLPSIPWIIDRDQVSPDLIEITSFKEAITIANDMFSASRGDVDDALYSLFLETEDGDHPIEADEEIKLTWDDMGIDPITDPADWVFTVVNDGHDTVTYMVPAPFFEDKGTLLSAAFTAEYRVKHLLPDDLGTEVKPGIFNHEMTPLSARTILLDHGFDESVELFALASSRMRLNPYASETNETGLALGLSNTPQPNEIGFALAAHPLKNSTFLAVLPDEYWSAHKKPPETIFISPLLKVPYGYSEFRPGLFERVASVHDVRTEMLELGYHEVSDLKALLKLDTSSNPIAPVPEPENSDWGSTVLNWPTLNEKERIRVLPNNEISFAVVEDDAGNAVGFFTPTSHYDEANSILREIDLGLESRLPPWAIKVAPNIFKLPGVNSINCIALMCRENFVDNVSFSFAVNIELATTDLSRDIGVSLL